MARSVAAKRHAVMKHEHGEVGVSRARETLGIHPERLGVMGKQVSRNGLKDREAAAGKQGCACQCKGRSSISQKRFQKCTAIVGRHLSIIPFGGQEAAALKHTLSLESEN